MNRIFGIIAAVGALAVGSSAQAELIAYEPFDYSVGSALVGQSGGSGFSGPWSVTLQNNGVLEATDAPDGRRALSFISGGSGNAFVTRDFTPVACLGLFFSFWVRDGADAAFYQVAVGNGTDVRPGRVRISAANRYGLNGTNNAVVPSQSVFDFVVVHYAPIGGSAFVPRLYINPGSELPSTPTQSGSSSTLATVSTVSINWVSPVTQSGLSFIDDIRIGTTYADVVPTPSAATAMLLGALLPLRRSRR